MTDNTDRPASGDANADANAPQNPAATPPPAQPTSDTTPVASAAPSTPSAPEYPRAAEPRANPYASSYGAATPPPVPGQQPTAPLYGATPSAAPTATNAFGQPAASGPQPTESSKQKRGAGVGLIAALAVGALVGGVSGAGVTAFALSSMQNSNGSSISSGPANITVNDPGDATAITAVAASAGPSVVTISVESSNTGGTGSGVILSDDGYILTNAHVVSIDGAAPTSVSVQTYDGRLLPAELVGTDPISDLAVIKVDATDLQPADFADSSELNVGDTAIAIGAPLGLANTVTNGIVSSLNRSITVASSAAPQTPDDQNLDESTPEDGPFDFWRFDTPENEGEQAPTAASSTIALSVIQTDAAINPGNSGGALLDSDGQVIGINVAIASAGSSQSTAGSIGVGFAIPSNFAQRIADEIISGGTGTHGLLGANVSEVSPDTATVVGALIQDVVAGGAAEDAGLEAGDIVTAVNGIPVTSATDLTAQIRALAAGADAQVSYVRDGQADELDVTLGSLQ